MRKILFFLTVLMTFGIMPVSGSVQNNDIISKFNHLSLQRLFDTANYYYNRNSVDTALICYNVIINAPVKDTDIKQQQIITEALHKSGVIYYRMYDYRRSYELLLRALDLCEKYQYDQYKLRIYINIGYIYTLFNEYNITKFYLSQALDLCKDSIDIMLLSNNLGYIELENGETDSVLHYLNRSLQISKQYNNLYLDAILNSIASFYKTTKQYDSACYYFQLSLDESKKKNKFLNEAENLSGLGQLFFEVGMTDSALLYIDLSNKVATENSFLKVLAENYLTSSQIEESKERYKNALEQFKQYANLKDSISNAKKFGEINQLQRLYEVSKTNQQIEQLAIEQRIKEKMIYYQKIIQFITLVVLLLVSGVLLYVFFQKRRLNRAYKVLFEKNLEIVAFYEDSREMSWKKYKQSALSDDMQEELLGRILTLMEDRSIICDPKFSIDKLAMLVQSNSTYVSQVINASLMKNFRSFLNGYRIQEAQRLFSTDNAAKYTIESIAFQVGFKSRTTFIDAFKETTGVSPSFYLKSMQKQRRDGQ